MRTLFLLPLITVSLQATEPLEARLQKAHRVSSDVLNQLQSELALANVSADTRAYHEANLNYLVARGHQAKEPKTDLALLEKAIKILEPRKDPESKALLGACLDSKIGFIPNSGMTLAPKASALFEMALQQSPGNPRALMFKGVHLLYTPSFFGGGPEVALPILAAAVKAAEAEKAPADAWSPAWGKAETYVWLAQAQRQSGQKAEALESLKHALHLDPAYGHALALMKDAK